MSCHGPGQNRPEEMQENARGSFKRHTEKHMARGCHEQQRKTQAHAAAKHPERALRKGSLVRQKQLQEVSPMEVSSYDAVKIGPAWSTGKPERKPERRKGTSRYTGNRYTRSTTGSSAKGRGRDRERSQEPYRSVSEEESICSEGEFASEEFSQINFKDCERVVRKNNISGPRFLNMAENNFQKFPQLRVPLLSKLCQEINKKEERRSLFSRKTPVHKIPDEKEFKTDDDGWSSFEDDDYESPTEDQDLEEDEADYESPTEDSVENGSDSLDYEPPPTNNEEEHANVISPACISSDSGYIDRLTTMNSSPHPPPPPQRHGPTLLPPVTALRTATFPVPSQYNEVNSGRSMRNSKSSAPVVDRTQKPRFVHPEASNHERDHLTQGKKWPFQEVPMMPPSRPHSTDKIVDHSTRIQRPPLPTERNAFAERRPPRPAWLGNRKSDEEDGPQRPLPQPVNTHYNSNTFPSSRVNRNLPRGPLSGVNSESMHSSGSLPSRIPPSNISRSFSEGPVNFKPMVPTPNKRMVSQTPVDEDEFMLHQDWYAGEINRIEAEETLMKINQDGAFLVRNSSTRSMSHPYVLMVLYGNKVYNIQIRYDEKEYIYLLGTGLRGKENFSSVADIVEHFRRTPLLLIDGKDRGSKNQCMLTYAAAAAEDF